MYSVWANQEATQRPTVGQSYSTLYLKAEVIVNSSYSAGEEDPDYLRITFYEETEEYGVELYVDFTGAFNMDAPAGTVVPVTTVSPVVITAEHVLDFNAM